jgi:uncharacterized membrane protein YecN with MAPEG domain
MAWQSGHHGRVEPLPELHQHVHVLAAAVRQPRISIEPDDGLRADGNISPFSLPEGHPMISLPITSITAMIASVIILTLTIRVIRFRRRDGVVLGDNNDRALAKAIRGQANATEQVPIALIVMGLAEIQGGYAPLLALAAVCLIVGRCMHGIYFAYHGTHWRLRFFGMWLTLIAQIVLLMALLLALIS